MRSYAFHTVDVFTETRFGGNQLAVVTDARGLSDAEMQSLAAEFNYSETTFVLPPADPAHDAQVRIFNRTYEMPFAGHPNVGTAFVLARERGGDAFVFEEKSGLVKVRITRDAGGAVQGATIAAPQPLSLGVSPAAADVATCIGMTVQDILTTTHAPVVASVGVTFLLVEVTGEALSRAHPDRAAFQRLRDGTPEMAGRLSIHLYARDGDGLRARMFSPLAGTWEDPATGSANAALAALLVSLGDAERAAFVVRQGVEMGRPSTLHLEAFRAADGVRAEVGGTCVPVFEGIARL